jgi:acetyltransferase-like isoleucine patch superfamily enzyme
MIALSALVPEDRCAHHRRERIIAEMNDGHRDPSEVRALFSRVTETQAAVSFWLLPPFYTDFGRNIRVGRTAFVNHACEFMDRGGITLEGDVLIGPCT